MVFFTRQGIIRSVDSLQHKEPYHCVTLECWIRTPLVNELNVLKNKVVNCLQAAALATNCQVISLATN